MAKSHIAYSPSTEDVLTVYGWFEKWWDRLSWVSANHGCGCCFNIHYVEAPQEALKELPPEMRAKDRECWGRILGKAKLWRPSGRGQTIAIAATAADEEAFLDFLRQTADIQLFASRAASLQELWVDRFPRYGHNRTKYFIWNKSYAWKPQVAAVWRGRNVFDTSRGWCFIENSDYGPVIEFSRTDMKRFLVADLAAGQYGRICSARNTRQKRFAKWVEAIRAWVLRNSQKLRTDTTSGVYCLPDAWRRWQASTR